MSETSFQGKAPISENYDIFPPLLISDSNFIVDRVVIDGAATEVPFLEAGTLLGKIDASGKFTGFDDAASDGSQKEENAVVLGEAVEVEGDIEAVVIVSGEVNKNVLKTTNEDDPNNTFAFANSDISFKDGVDLSGGGAGGEGGGDVSGG